VYKPSRPFVNPLTQSTSKPSIPTSTETDTVVVDTSIDTTSTSPVSTEGATPATFTQIPTSPAIQKTDVAKDVDVAVSGNRDFAHAGSSSVEATDRSSMRMARLARAQAKSFEETHERLTIWVNTELKRDFEALAKAERVSKTSLLNEAFTDLLRKYSDE